VVRLRGLPYSSKPSNVISFLSPVEVLGNEDGVVFTYQADGRPTGEAYVELPSEEAAQQAMKKHKETLGSRWAAALRGWGGAWRLAGGQGGPALARLLGCCSLAARRWRRWCCCCCCCCTGAAEGWRCTAQQLGLSWPGWQPRGLVQLHPAARSVGVGSTRPSQQRQLAISHSIIQH
jgi:hypothetical protein